MTPSCLSPSMYAPPWPSGSISSRRRATAGASSHPPSFERLAERIQSFRIVRAALHVHFQIAKAILAAAGLETGRAGLAENLVQVVFRVLRQPGLKGRQRVSRAALLPGDAAQLEVSVGFARVDCNGGLKVRSEERRVGKEGK